MKKGITSLLAVVLALVLAMGQSGFEYTSTTYLKDEDPYKLVKPGAYALSTKKFKDQFGEEPTSTLAMLQIADNYRLNGQPVEAALWYSRGISQPRSPKDYLHFAYVLKMTGHCEEANIQYRNYLAMKELPPENYCTRIDEDELQIKVVWEHLPYINSAGTDFAAAPWGDKLIFTSDRDFTKPGRLKDPWTMRNFTSIFVAERNKRGEWGKLRRLQQLDSRFHDGAVVPHPNGATLYFTRSSRHTAKGNDLYDLEIHRATAKGNGWRYHGPLSFNNKDYGVAHPAISNDGNVMVFASDMPGGHGGMDLYRVERVGNSWGTPVNLGPHINSAGNELFPSISADGFLFFASDGLAGFGGMDVFAAPPEQDGGWRIGFNLGPQVNSSYDDFALVTLPGRKSGYISSNRPGGMGLDDIYYWTSDKPLGDRPMVATDLIVVHHETGIPIQGATVNFGRQILKTNDIGRQRLSTPTPGRHAVKIEAPGFIAEDSFVDMPSAEPVIVRLKPAAYQPVIFEARDVDTRRLVDNPIIEVFETTFDGRLIPVNKYANYAQANGLPSGGPATSLSASTQVAGGALFELKDRITGKPLEDIILVPSSQRTGLIPEGDLGASDRLEWLRQNYTPRNRSNYAPLAWTDIRITEIPHPEKDALGDAGTGDYNSLPWMLDERKRYQVRARAEGYLGNLIEVAAPEIKGAGPLEKKPVFLEPLILGIKESDLRAEATFTLEGIYYDYDKDNIRGDARPILDELAKLMSRYPGMMIELSSHTDSRGNDMYNLDLSQRRADSAVAYLNQKGISSDRMFARGYGFRKLVNNCKPGVKCSEEEHQLNRRTEFRIIRMD